MVAFMWVSDFFKAVKPPEHRLAWLVAIATDAIQIFALPLFAVEDDIETAVDGGARPRLPEHQGSERGEGRRRSE